MKDIQTATKEMLVQVMAAALLLLGLAFVWQQTSLDWQEKEDNGNVAEMIDRITGENIYVQNFNLNNGFQRTILYISQEDLAGLKAQDRLYQSLPDKDLYRVDWTDWEKGHFMAVVDPEKEEVIMFYRLSGVEFS